MLPLGLPFCRRQSSSSFGTVSLTPPGVSTSQLWDALILDIVTVTINGFDCIDAQGKRGKVVLDTCRILCDYSDSSQVLQHVIKHMGGASCVYCSLRHRTCEGGPEYAYTTKVKYDIHSF